MAGTLSSGSAYPIVPLSYIPPSLYRDEAQVPWYKPSLMNDIKGRVLSQGLEFACTFNETGGEDAYDAVSRTRALSVTGATFVPDVMGRVISFAGASGDGIEIPENQRERIRFDGTRDWAWVIKFNTMDMTSNWQEYGLAPVLFSDGQFGGTTGHYMSLQTDGGVALVLNNGDGSTIKYPQTAGMLTANTWYTLIVEFDYAQQTISTYRNNLADVVSGPLSGTFVPGTGSFYIAKYYDLAFPIYGTLKISELRVYSRLLDYVDKSMIFAGLG